MADKGDNWWESNDEALWILRRSLGLSDIDKNGWKKMVFALVSTYRPEDLVLSSRQRMILALMGHPDQKRRRGPKEKWSPEARIDLLAAIDEKKAGSANSKETDKSIIERCFAEELAKHGVEEKTLQNIVSVSRRMAQNGKLN